MTAEPDRWWARPAGPTPAPADLLATAHRLRADARAHAAATADPAAQLDVVLVDLAFGDRSAAALRADWRAALDALTRCGPIEPWLFGGAAHVGWVAHRIGCTPPPALDDTLVAWLAAYPDTGGVDLLRGALGLGVYALHHPDRRTRTRLVGAVLDLVAARVERDGDGAFLRVADTPWMRTVGLAGHQLVGAGHGAAGLVAYLADVAASDLPDAARARRECSAALGWLLARRRPRGGSVFPRSAQSAATPARSAWCHGDPGLWLALDRVRRTSEHPDAAAAWADVAAAVPARRAADTGVRDGCLCHGAAGLAWIATRIAERGPRAGRAVARRVAGAWAARLIAARRAGPLGYVRRPGPPERCAGLLEGDAGVALVLHRLVEPGGGAGWEPLLWG